MHPRTFRFGVAGSVESAEQWEGFVRRIEELGYATVLLGDHFDVYDACGAVAGLAWAASATSTLHVGTIVLANDFRHPAVLAKEFATLDLLSRGRAELGIGAGWLRSDYDVVGLPYDPPGVRVDRLAEALTVITSSWTGERFSFAGDHYTITDYRGVPVPERRPHPLIMVGGGSPRILRIAGRQADIVGIHWAMGEAGGKPDVGEPLTPHEQVLRKIGWVREGAGDRFDDLELQMMCSFRFGRDRRSAAEELAATSGGNPDDLLDSPSLLLGSVDDMCETLRQRRELYGISYILVTEGHEEFAPVVARLSGT